MIVVFDAYKVKGNPGSVEHHGGLSVVYTKEAETADQYIEKVTHELGKKHRVRVATSDALEQIIILGHGAPADFGACLPPGGGGGRSGHPRLPLRQHISLLLVGVDLRSTRRL